MSCPEKNTNEGEKEIQEVTASLAAAKESMDAAVLSDLDGIFTLKEEQKTVQKAFTSKSHP